MKTLEIKTATGSRIFHHRGTPADQGVIKQMFVSHDYSLDRLRRGAELVALGRSLQKPLILDAGANIGASVCWFALNYPGCHIVAIEPDAANCDLLRRNCEGLNVDVRQAALGARDGKVSLVDPGEGEWSYRTAADANGAIPRISVSRLVKEKIAAGYAPFIAKIDIEGGEADLFTPPCDWVDSFPLLTVELHDFLLPGQGTSRNFLQCVVARDRDFVSVGENIFSIRNG